MNERSLTLHTFACLRTSQLERFDAAGLLEGVDNRESIVFRCDP